jgi:preprotein translocase subunit YajC
MLTSAAPLLILAIPILLLWNMATKARRQQREIRSVQEVLVSGVEVMTGSGMFATVVNVDDERVVLETSPGQHSTWDRRAVVKIVTRPADALTSDDESDAEAS